MKENEKQTATTAAATVPDKNGFVIDKKRIQLACEVLEDPELGSVFRNVYMFLTERDFKTQLKDVPFVCYKNIINGIKEQNAIWEKKVLERRKKYEETRRKANEFDKNNLDKTDNSDKTENYDKTENSKNALRSGEVLNGEFEDVVSSDMVGSVMVGSVVSSLQDVENTTSSNSYKNYNSKNKVFFNKDYTRNYLLQKKLFLKKEAFDNFFDYNCEIMHWAYKPETAFRRWIKKNPEDEEKPKEEKKAPEQPRTPAALQELDERLHTLWRETFTVTDFKTWLTDFYLIEAKYTVDGYELTFSTVSKFKAEHIREHFEDKIRATFEGVKNCKVKTINYKFVYCSELCELQNIKIEKPKEAAKHFTEMPASLQNRFKGKTPPAVYVDETPTLN